MEKKLRYIFLLFHTCLLLSATVSFTVDEKNILSEKFYLSETKGTTYQLLRQISEQINYTFIYDSQTINNEKKAKLPKGNYTLEEVIYKITNNRKIKLRTLGKHILLYIPNENEKTENTQPFTTEEPAKERFFTISGILTDRISGDVVPYGIIGLDNSSVGTVSNQSGEFKLVIPDSLKNNTVRISHLGFQTQEITASLLEGQRITFELNPEVISLQEVIVRKVNPIQVLKETLGRRDQNYSNQPVNITAFYREGSSYKKKNIRLAEAILKLYKTEINAGTAHDQAKLLKMRIINSKEEKDSVIIKMKSGIFSILQLDIMKNLPDFLSPENESLYDYIHSDITVIDGRRINVISFEPKEFIKDPLFKGEMYIDAENFALVQAYFEINPPHIKKATNLFIEKRAKKVNTTPEKISYLVSYKLSNGKYYVNHIRGDLHFKVKKKNRLFASSQHMWFEMVSCEIDFMNVVRFPRTDRLPAHQIFSETKFVYDPNFWGNFNTILPEEQLKDFIIRYFSNQRE